MTNVWNLYTFSVKIIESTFRMSNKGMERIIIQLGTVQLWVFVFQFHSTLSIFYIVEANAIISTSQSFYNLCFYNYIAKLQIYIIQYWYY